jgi:hypothetical protein
MKKLSLISLYAFGLALVLISALLLTPPPTTALAAGCYALCQYGDAVHVEGDTCSCTDNVGCTFTKNGKKYSAPCAKRVGYEETPGLEEGDS